MWRSLLAGAAVSILAACHSNRETVPAADNADHPEPMSIGNVLTSQHPADLYEEAFGTFRMESFSHLNLGAKAPAAIEGHTKLAVSESGDFEFVREPLSPKGSVVLRCVQKRYYLKSGGAETFRRVRGQKEFEWWLDHAFRELFDEFAKAGFSDPGQGTISQTQICWTKSAGKLCVDPASGLPLSGSLTVQKTDGLAPRIEFKVEALPPQSVRISAP
ncbi:MAG: hypothetical protein V1798_01445 [Pseudomonadota bacterium]